MTFESLYQQLNNEQRLAVDALDGPVMVLAGPGTGKTQLLSVRTANILRKTDLYPSNILLLTFTNAGVKAMRERLARLIGPDGYDVVVETFHGFSNSLITESELATNIKGERIQMTDLERITLLEYLLDHTEGVKAIRPANSPYHYRRSIESALTTLKKDGVSPQEFADFLNTYKVDGKLLTEKHLDRLKAFSKIYSAYEEAKSPQANVPVFDKRGRYDYDDMIMLALESLQSEPDLLAQYQEQFQYVMVDEFQDTNGAQLKLLRVLFPQLQSNVCVVGDDDQSIYRFQGASVGNFHLFEELYQNPQKILLKKNYRSIAPILNISERIISQIPLNERVMEKQLDAMSENGMADPVIVHRYGTREEELTFLVQELQKLPEEERNETAVLVRTRREAQMVIEAFLQGGISYTTDGKEDIRGEARVQQLVKILKLAEGNLEFEEKDLLLFELLLFDFWEIDHGDLLRFARYVSQKKNDYRQKRKRKTSKKPKESRLEESHVAMDLDGENPSDDYHRPTLFSEILLRFPLPARVYAKQHEPPTHEETNQLSLLEELSLSHPNRLHRAAWAVNRLCARSGTFPVYGLIMEFIQDSGMIDYILQTYQDDEVVRLRDLRSITSFVENLKKANQADPGILVNRYLEDLGLLEKHDIQLTGEMVSSAQEGVKIYTAHGSKGLEFDRVYIPFCLQDKSWPKKYRSELIPLPHEVLVGQELIQETEAEKKLHEYDETRLFYVAATRARKQLFFSASPEGNEVFSKFLSTLNLVPDEPTPLSEEAVLVHILKKSPQPDPLQHSQETLEGLVEELSLSPSSVNTFLACERRFLYHNLLRAPQPKTQALVYGQCIHKALEKSYRRLLSEGSLPPLSYFEEQFFQELDWQGIDQAIRASCLDKLEDAKRWYKEALESEQSKPLELERKITRKLPQGISFSGQFDKVERVGKNAEVVIVDYKTGQPDKHIKAINNCSDLSSEDCDDYLRQLVAYKMLYDRGHRSLKASSGSLVFIDPAKSTNKKHALEEGQFVTKTVPLTEEMVQQYEKILENIWQRMKTLEFPRLKEYDSNKCDYCPYKGVCWK